MGTPNWNKIPFEKMPKWKKDEILLRAKKTIQEAEEVVVEKPKKVKTVNKEVNDMLK